MLYLCIFFFVTANAQQNSQKIIPTSDKLVSEVYTLSIEQGIAAPSLSGPWSVEEVLSMFSRINRESLSSAGKLRYDSVADVLSRYNPSSEEGFSGATSLMIGFEGYYHTNDVDFQAEKDWYWDNEKRLPMILLEGEAWLGESFYLYSNFGVKNNRFFTPDADAIVPSDIHMFSPTFSSNILRNSAHDFDTPNRAFLAFGGDHYSFQMGRDLISWGAGVTGNLIIDDHVKYHEFIRLALFAEKVKFTSLTLFLEPPGYTTRDRAPYVPSQDSDPTIRMLLAHRFEFTPATWLRIELSENVMYQDTHFNAKYLNPLFIFHNLSNRSQFNAIADITISATLVPNLLLYASWAIDQVAAPGEGNDQPNAMGYQLGILTLHHRPKGTWNLQAEVVYTDPYLYLRDKVDFVVMTRERDQYYGYVPQREFLGYQFGGDAFIASLMVDWKGINNFSGGGELFYMAHGSTHMDTPYVFGEMPVISTPSAPITHTFRTGLWGSYRYSGENLLHTAQLWARIDLIQRQTDGNSAKETDLQLIMGISHTW